MQAVEILERVLQTLQQRRGRAIRSAALLALVRRQRLRTDVHRELGDGFRTRQNVARVKVDKLGLGHLLQVLDVGGDCSGAMSIILIINESMDDVLLSNS